MLRLVCSLEVVLELALALPTAAPTGRSLEHGSELISRFSLSASVKIDQRQLAMHYWVLFGVGQAGVSMKHASLGSQSSQAKSRSTGNKTFNIVATPKRG